MHVRHNTTKSMYSILIILMIYEFYEFIQFGYFFLKYIFDVRLTCILLSKTLTMALISYLIGIVCGIPSVALEALHFYKEMDVIYAYE